MNRDAAIKHISKKIHDEFGRQYRAAEYFGISGARLSHILTRDLPINEEILNWAGLRAEQPPTKYFFKKAEGAIDEPEEAAQDLMSKMNWG